MNRMIINAIGREKRVAILKNNRLEKLVVRQPKQQSLVGGIFLGIVEKVLPGMNAAFVHIGLEKNGFLQREHLPSFRAHKEDKSISSFLHQGERILVQVKKDATGDKGPRLTGVIELSGNLVVYEPKGHTVTVSKKIADLAVREKWRDFGKNIKQGDEGLLFRTNCADHTEEEVVAEIESLREKYENILRLANTLKKPGLVVAKNTFLDEIHEEMKRLGSGEVIVDSLQLKQELAALQNDPIEIIYHHEKEGIFSAYRVEHELDNVLRKNVPLDNGATLVFDEAEALTIIDVNTGKFSGKEGRAETVLKTNELAADEIARQIVLRDLAGMVLIDFIDMKSDREREIIVKRLESALGADRKRTRIVGFTPLGILQLTRKKEQVSLTEGLTVSCSTCEGAGRVLSPETVAFRLERELLEYRGRDEEAILIETTEDVRRVFAGEQQTEQKRLEEIIGFDINFLIKDGLAKPFYRVNQMGDRKEIEKRIDE